MKTARAVRRTAGVATACGLALALVTGCNGGSKGASSSSGGGSAGTTGSTGSTTAPGSTTTAPGSGPASPSQGSTTGQTTGTPALAGGTVPVYPAGQVLPAFTGNLDKYTAPMKAADAKGLQVWIEADLVKAWLAGPDQFDSAIEKVTAEAKAAPNVTGFKIADELGKQASHAITSQDQAMQFLHDARAALHANDPGKLVLIDIIGSALGCVPGNPSPRTATCVSGDDAREPVTHLDFLDQIAKSGYVDAMDVTTNLLQPSDYASGWHVSRTAAEQAAMAEMKRRGWDKEIILSTRKALSWPTAGNIETPDAAASMVPDFIDVPLSDGLAAVDVWSWSQVWGKSGATVHLMSAGYTTNSLWNALVQRHNTGDKLYVHYTPSHSEGTLSQDMDYIAKAFTGVFCAAGTG